MNVTPRFVRPFINYPVACPASAPLIPRQASTALLPSTITFAVPERSGHCNSELCQADDLEAWMNTDPRTGIAVASRLGDHPLETLTRGAALYWSCIREKKGTL